MPAADIAAAGTPSVTVFNAAPGGGTSNAQIFTVNNPVPTMTGLSPSAVTAGGPAFTLTVNGTGFVSTSAVRWNGVNRTTAFVSAVQLTAAIPAADIAATGTAPVTVFNSNPGGGTSNAQTLTISATPVGLVAAYSFNAGTGTTVADVSGNGNTGTINGATWTTAGRFGGALSFNGTSNMVTIADSSSLDLTVGMTLEAWVFPTATPTNGRSIIAKEQPGDIVYSLHASSRPNHRPATMVFVAGSERQLIGGTRVSTNTWVHLAATYDGTTQRLYVNGVQVASRAQTGPIVTSNSPLRIGGNAVFGEFFQGRIDEVRIYNRALSATEIQNDMTAPLGP